MSLEMGNKYIGYGLRVPLNYVDAIISAGGTPVCLPPLEDDALVASILLSLDGILFIGGDDYWPDHYGGHPQPSSELIPERRDRFDITLAHRVLRDTNLPVLGICGGHQLICISQGGSLIQDIKTEWLPPQGQAILPHSKNDRYGAQKNRYRHPVRMETNSLIARIIDAPAAAMLPTNSSHHQAVDPCQPGLDLCATAWTADGIVEAIEPSPDSAWSRTGRFVLGVQWHPEQLQDETPHRSLFAALVTAAIK
jgi:gamma-glutamyl-gamma-aminobutyrate hydrolase PuuD